ncbi:UPF0280 family protein [Sneathiella glossodoripedis]|uniref:UPF0280 family protein n=1 Tax=Sneathiella glossodoripedis TaxID=418853 RepID=UPI0006885608|nr:UPF0280 family protein [Sneathiella glossodoripedis]
MVGQAVVRMMPDGRRLHLQHGPIDLICLAEGPDIEVYKAYQQADRYFETLLQGLVNDLPILRQKAGEEGRWIKAPNICAVSENMIKAAEQFSHSYFVTPMAGVAGAVADAVLTEMCRETNLAKAYVNNGGDIAFSLSPGKVFKTVIVDNPDNPRCDAEIEITNSQPVRGIATSGWRGRSLSMGIADAVTVLARNAVDADIAATLIAGDVYVADNAVLQRPAEEIDASTDLGRRLVTVDVKTLSPQARREALMKGMRTANVFMSKGVISGAYLSLQGEVKSVSMSKRIFRERLHV